MYTVHVLLTNPLRRFCCAAKRIFIISWIKLVSCGWSYVEPDGSPRPCVVFLAVRYHGIVLPYLFVPALAFDSSPIQLWAFPAARSSRLFEY